MDDHYHLSIAYNYIRDHLASLKCPVIFELGMCDACHTKMLLSWCDTPAYYGFEPDPRNIKLITGDSATTSRSVMIASAIGKPCPVNFYPDAVGRVTGRVPFYLSTAQPDGKIGSSSLSEFTPILTKTWPWLKCDGTVEVQCWRLDDFCLFNKIGHIDFIWMDVQGAERFVFDGAEHILKKTSLIWTEYDGGTLYKDSSTRDDILARFPGWTVVADCGGDVLLKNPVSA